ncbi:hypothetical protein E2C01_062237 [Portunus trituberculatus]|uniref:Uncharacterized protein n=1 Tax=Portunus trituberculatus TaxID=210409 RepID=A0A5B7HFK3_PORTR|nr:hypothetical protein [Portunus trituberculatus]
MADLLKVDEDSYVVRLGSPLTGKAANIYISLSSNTISSYPLLKKALLTNFHTTSDGYHTKFHGTKIHGGNSYQQFSAQLMRFFQTWIDSSKAESNYDSLKDFIMLDQFLALLSTDLWGFSEGAVTKDLCGSCPAR